MIDVIARLREASSRPAGVYLALAVVLVFVVAVIWCVSDGDHHTVGQHQATVFCALVLLTAAATVLLTGPAHASRLAARGRPVLASRSIAILDPPPRHLLSR